jgi:integrase
MASFLKTSTGKIRVQIEHNGKREYKTFRTKSLASTWAIQREAELERGLIASVDLAQRTSLGEVIQDYRARVMPTKRGHHIKFTLNLLEREFGKSRLMSITVRDVSSFRDSRLGAGASGSTVIKDLNLLRVLIDHAIRELGIHLPANPARICKNPKAAPSRNRVLNADEQAQLFAAFVHPMLPAITTLALETAMRLGELLNMRWPDINFKTRTLNIPLTKTDKPRIIPLSTNAIKTLHAIPRHIDITDNRLFRCWKRADSFEKTFRRSVLTAKLENFRFHDLRHTATSRLAQKLPNVIELSAITGHTSLQMLQRYYHISPEDLARKLG